MSISITFFRLVSIHFDDFSINFRSFSIYFDVCFDQVFSIIFDVCSMIFEPISTSFDSFGRVFLL